MGWLGPTDRIKDCLRVHADKDDDGNALIRGSNISSFLGAGIEYCLGDDTEVRVDGEWVPLIPLLYGGVCVHVI